MTNPLEQIRELEKKWYIQAAESLRKGMSSAAYDKGAGSAYQQCAHDVLAILNASQGYVCVPVETIKLAFDALHRSAPITEVLCHIPGAQQLHHEAHQLMLAASKETNRE